MVASWEAKAPGFVLGAMLPDFATMSETRLERHGPPEDYRDPTAVASRVERILRGRRRLALDARKLDITARGRPRG